MISIEYKYIYIIEYTPLESKMEELHKILYESFTIDDYFERFISNNSKKLREISFFNSIDEYDIIANSEERNYFTNSISKYLNDDIKTNTLELQQSETVENLKDKYLDNLIIVSHNSGLELSEKLPENKNFIRTNIYKDKSGNNYIKISFYS